VERVLSSVIVAFLYALPKTSVYAAQDWGTCVIDEVATIQCLVPLFENIVMAVMQISGVVLFIMFIIGGYHLLLSGGDPKKLEQGRNTLMYAILGLVLIVVAYLIIQLISVITGVPNLNQFTIPDSL
jgi:hypothetical protein